LHVFEYDLQDQIQGRQNLLSDDPNSFYRGNFLRYLATLTNTNMKSLKEELDL